MSGEEYRNNFLSYTPEELVDTLMMQIQENSKLRLELKEMEVKHMRDINKHREQVEKTAKINEYWEKERRPLRRNDFDNDEVIKRYVGGDSAYRIAKDLDVGQMTIISRLKRAGVYEGRKHNIK